MAKGVLNFFFEYGAGGCLWAADDATLKKLDVGPVDAACYNLKRELSKKPALPLSDEATRLRDRLDFQHAGYLNPLYQPDPSLWTQSLCNRFNADVEELLALLRTELSADYDIIDKQERYMEDPNLKQYLADHPSLRAIDHITAANHHWMKW